jgi:hypothetical protein
MPYPYLRASKRQDATAEVGPIDLLAQDRDSRPKTMLATSQLAAGVERCSSLPWPPMTASVFVSWSQQRD